MIPDEWLVWEGQEETPDQLREVYYSFLSERLKNSDQFIKTVQDAAETQQQDESPIVGSVTPEADTQALPTPATQPAPTSATAEMGEQSDDGIVTVFGDCKTGTATAVEVVVPAIPGDGQI